MTGKLFDPHLDLLEQRFQALRDQIGARPEACRPELEGALQELSQAIAALRADREAGETPQPDLPGDRGAQARQAGKQHSPMSPEGLPSPCEAMLHHVFNAIPDLLTVHDRDFNTIMSNWHGFESVPEAERLGRPKCYRVYHHRDRPCDNCHALEILATGQPVKVTKVNPVDGRVRDVSAYPIRDESGRVVLVAEYVRDITDRQLAEEALAEQRELMDYVIRHDPNAIAVYDNELRYVFVSERYLNDYGVKEKDIIGKHHYEVFPEMPQRWKEVHQRVLAGAVERSDDDYFERPDGSITYNRWECRPWYHAGGRIGGMITYTEVTTERKLAEKALAAHLQFLQLLLDTIPNPIFFKDAQGFYLGCNKAFEGFMRVTRQEIVGKSVYDLSPRELADEYHRMDLEAFQATGTQVYESQVQAADGARRHVVFHKATFPDPDGSVGGLVGIITDITGLKQAEAELRQSEQRFRDITENAAEWVWEVDPQGKYTHSSPVVEQLLGYNPEEILGKHFYDFFLPDQREDLKNAALAAFAAKQPIRDFLNPNLHKDGHIVQLSTSGIPILDEQGKLLGYRGADIDITARKRAEAALRESEERFRAIFEYAPVGIGMADLMGRFLQANQALLALLGYSADEFRGVSFQEMTHPEDLLKCQMLLEGLLTGEQRYFDTEKRCFRKDGNIVWAQVTMALMRDIQGEPQYLITTVIDITARKQAAAELRQSEQRFRLMAETIQDVFWMATPDIGKMAYVSPGYAQVWGRTCQELYQSPQSFLDAIHPEDREQVRSEIAAARAQSIPWGHEYRIIRPDRTVRWIHDRGFPVRDDQGRVILFTGVATDITGRKALEAQLLQAQKMEAVGRLAGGVAHDFNNLLMAITGYGELMRANILRDDPLYSHLENILKAGDRAAALTQQLLTFSRQKIVHPQVIDLNRVVLDLEPMLRRLIGEDLDLEVVSDRRLGSVKADPGQIGQVIMNLVVNARDAMPQGGRLTLKTAPVNFTVGCHNRFGLTPPGPYVRLVVEDTGVGMDEATQAHVFEPFFTTKEPGKGTGLGLSTVYGIVKQSGGYLDLESSPGAGSTFTIYLPRLEAIVEPPKAKIPLTASFRGEETVLLVEDEDVLRGLLAKFLRLYGYTVLEARHGGEALLICERHQGPIDMMVTDVVMPQMSGRELADRLTPLRPEMRVLYMSGYSEEALVQHGVADLSVAFLQKPFKPIELARRVHAVLHPPVSQ